MSIMKSERQGKNRFHYILLDDVSLDHYLITMLLLVGKYIAIPIEYCGSRLMGWRIMSCLFSTSLALNSLHLITSPFEAVIC